MTETTTERTSTIVKAAEELAEVWGRSYPMEQEEIFYNLDCTELQPIIDMLRAVGADTVADNVEYAHARCDYDEELDAHHALYLKRAAKGDI